MTQYPGHDPDDPFSRPPNEEGGGNPPAPPAAPPPQPSPENPWSGYGQPGYPAYGYATTPPSHPQATTSLVLGLVGLVGGCLCGLPLLVAPFAWVVGAKTRREIAASNGQLGGEGNAQAGFVMGIIGTVLLVLALLAVVGVGVLAIASDSSGTSTEF